jgi:hypothetical protein
MFRLLPMLSEQLCNLPDPGEVLLSVNISFWLLQDPEHLTHRPALHRLICLATDRDLLSPLPRGLDDQLAQLLHSEILFHRVTRTAPTTASRSLEADAKEEVEEDGDCEVRDVLRIDDRVVAESLGGDEVVCVRFSDRLEERDGREERQERVEVATHLSPDLAVHRLDADDRLPCWSGDVSITREREVR